MGMSPLLDKTIDTSLIEEKLYELQEEIKSMVRPSHDDVIEPNVLGTVCRFLPSRSKQKKADHLYALMAALDKFRVRLIADFCRYVEHRELHSFPFRVVVTSVDSSLTECKISVLLGGDVKLSYALKSLEIVTDDKNSSADYGARIIVDGKRARYAVYPTHWWLSVNGLVSDREKIGVHEMTDFNLPYVLSAYSNALDTIMASTRRSE